MCTQRLGMCARRPKVRPKQTKRRSWTESVVNLEWPSFNLYCLILLKISMGAVTSKVPRWIFGSGDVYQTQKGDRAFQKTTVLLLYCTPFQFHSKQLWLILMFHLSRCSYTIILHMHILLLPQVSMNEILPWCSGCTGGPRACSTGQRISTYNINI